MLSNIGNLSQKRFDDVTSRFVKWLYEANARLPIPQHPAVRMYHLRKQNKNTDNSATYKRSSNPQRSNARTRQKRRDKYLFELAQHKYYNRRKDVVNMIMQDEDRQECKVPLQALEDRFKNIYETSNDRILEEYKNKIPSDDIQVTLEDIEQELCSIKMDSAPGGDKVYVRTIRDLKIAGIIKIIIEIMLLTSYVPHSFHEGRTVMIPKSGDTNDVNNWRPITIFSVIRRVIERVLDKKLRSQIVINRNQRGFVAGIQGCHINSILVNACLQKAKNTKTDCVAVFLDVSKAYDRVGHAHIARCLAEQGVSRNLSRLIMSLLKDNFTRIQVGKDQRSSPIYFKCGVPQGCPLSPILFDLAVNFLYDNLC